MTTIDLRSDTVTRPTAAMRRAIADADVGDDVLDGDPTTRRLEARVAEVLGKERALFFPTGTMANQAALWLLGVRGTELLVDAASHILDWEVGGAAALAGVQPRAVMPRPGALVADADAFADAIATYGARASVLSFENTHNSAGGVVTSLDQTNAIVAHARAANLRVHLDGARLWNAAIATGETEARLAAASDTVMVSFAKGLGAPAGAALAGSADALADAWRVRKRLGGGMRQSGILAAAALYGLTHHRERLVDDHARARRLAERVDGAGGARVVPPDTNIVMIDLLTPSSVAVAERLAGEGVRVSAWSRTRVRVVTHLDVDDAAIDRAADAIARVLEQTEGGAVSTAEVSVRR